MNRPLLWSYGENWWREFGAQNTDGRVLFDSLACSPHAPYSAWHSSNDDTNCCYRSGTWNAVQDRGTGTIHITVSGYEINPDQMPVINGDKSSGSYGKNVGCFSSGAIWIVQPFNTITTGTEHGKEPYYDVVKTYGQGSFATTVKDANLRATTLSGVTVEQGKDGFVQMAPKSCTYPRSIGSHSKASPHSVDQTGLSYGYGPPGTSRFFPRATPSPPASAWAVWRGTNRNWLPVDKNRAVQMGSAVLRSGRDNSSCHYPRFPHILRLWHPYRGPASFSGLPTPIRPLHYRRDSPAQSAGD